MSEKNTEPFLELQKFYLKDVSFESPNSPEIFRSDKETESSMHIETNYNKLEEGIYEVILSLSISISNEDGPVMLIEVEQAGIFTVMNFPENDLQHILHAYCANILFPYAREEVSNVSSKGGFPPVLLGPVNFDALLEQKKQENKPADSDESEVKH